MTEDSRRTTRHASHPAHVIAIDGPAASGKSSTAAAVARRLGFAHVDSGALYRALTWISVHRAVAAPEAILALAERLHVGLVHDHGRAQVHIDGVDDVESAIRSADVNARVSSVAAMPAMRDWVNVKLRRAVEDLPGAVIDGRDIGTVVFPNAGLKVYLIASAGARAERRLRQRGTAIDSLELAAETASLEVRDRLDSGRATAPLSQAADAVVLDTTAMTFDQQVDRIVGFARDRGLG